MIGTAAEVADLAVPAFQRELGRRQVASSLEPLANASMARLLRVILTDTIRENAEA